MTGQPIVVALREFLASRSAKYLQVLVTASLAAWLVLALDSRVWTALRGVGVLPLAAAIVLFSSAQIFGGLRLAILLPDHSMWPRALVATWIGYFWANFLPGTVGGDLVRGLRLKREGVELPALLGALVLDRLINLSAVLFVLIVSGFWFVGAMLTGHSIWLPVAFGLGLLGLVALLMITVPTARRMIGLVSAPARTLVRSPLRLLGVAGMSLASLGVAIVAQWLIARRLGIAVSFGQFAGIICFVTVIVMVPISLNGLGLQEASFVAVLTSAGVPADLALSFSLLSRALIVGAGVVAGLVVLADRLAASRYSKPQ